MENAGYFFAAFALIWALLFGYVLILINRQKQLRHALDSLKARLEESEKGKETKRGARQADGAAI